VVIAIIAILAALLMPALKSARENGKMIKCMNNHRQVLLACHLFAQDNDGVLPTVDHGTYGGTAPPVADFQIYNELAPYVGGKNTIRTMFACPNAVVSASGNWSYGFLEGVFKLATAEGVNPSKNLAEVPGKMMLTGDGADNNVPLIMSPTLRPFRPSGFDYDGDGERDIGAGLSNATDHYQYNALRFWHRKRAVVGIADGSARTLTVMQWLYNDGGLWGP
jgi:hypothetical protein